MDSFAKKKYIFNGELITSENFNQLDFSNRAFHFGDSLFETIRYANKNILFLGDHILRLKLSMTTLKMKIPPHFSFEYFLDKISDIIYANDLQDGGARIRLTVYRSGSGAYYPETNEVNFLLEAEKLDSPYFLNISNGIVIDLYKDIFKPINRLSSLKTGNALIYILAAINRDSLRLDDCLILNEKANICEATASNIFITKGNLIMTPPLEEGCINGIMRGQIKKIAENKKMLFIEKPFTQHTILDAEEFFLTNTIQGIQWVRQFQSKLYESKKTAQFFVDELNNLIK